MSTSATRLTSPVRARHASAVHLAAILAALPVLAPPARAGDPLGEAEAVELAIAQPDRLSLLASQQDLAEGQVAAAGLLPNPQVAYSREQVIRSPRDDINEFVWVTQDVDIANRRGLRRAAATLRRDATGSAGAASRIEVAARAREGFYELLHRQHRVEELARWQQRVAGVADRVTLREAAGESSGYETLRIAAEQSTLRTNVGQEESRVASAWSALETLCGVAGLRDERDSVVGQLLPAPPPPLEGLLEALADRPDLLALQREADALSADRRMAGRAWIPDVTLGVGSKRVDDDLGRDSGPMVSLGLAVPLFDRGQVARQTAEAQAAIARSRYDLTLLEARGELRGAWSAYVRLREQAVTRAVEVGQLSRTLVDIAEAGFLGGELTLVELLDAYRTEHGGRLQVLDLESAARNAQLELDRLSRLTAE